MQKCSYPSLVGSALGMLSGFTAQYLHQAEHSLQVSRVEVDNTVKKGNADIVSKKGCNMSARL